MKDDLFGVMTYVSRDLERARHLLGESQSMPLWKATLFMGVLGLIIGHGAFVLVGSMIPASTLDVASLSPWGAATGSIATVTAGAWRLTSKSERQQASALPRKQTFVVSDRGVMLRSEHAESTMEWPHFIQVGQDPDLLVLKTREGAITMFRPEFFDEDVQWHALKDRIRDKLGAAPQ